MDDERDPFTFEDNVFLATGLTLEDCLRLGAEQERLEQERIRDAGYCCRAGYVAGPEFCPWHRKS